MKRKNILAWIVAAVLVMVCLVSTGCFEGEEEDEIGTPSVSMNWIEDPDISGDYTGNVLRISGGDVPELSDSMVVYVQGANMGSKTLEDVASGGLGVGAMIMRFSDNYGNNRLNAADTFSLIGVNPGDTIELIYIPTDERMYISSF